MNTKMKTKHTGITNAALFNLLVLTCIPASATQEHKTNATQAISSVTLSAKQLTTAEIVVSVLQPRPVTEEITAPGEILLNAYRTATVTPRVPAQVVKRLAKLGDIVTQGQPLVTLSSVDMATAQGDLFIAEREWKRVKRLGRKVVSAQRYTAARVTHEQAKARVRAYGMTQKQVSLFIKNGDAAKADGSFQLLAPQAGTIIRDNFILGELIQPGKQLFVISDESLLWVEAKVTPAQAVQINPGSTATVIYNHKQFAGRVVQIHQALDEDTRTLGVRIELNNPDGQLYPGIFVEVRIKSRELDQALTVPVNAVLRNTAGERVVFVEVSRHATKAEFKPHKVNLIKVVGDVSIIKGIATGTKVVTQGAFFVQSEMAKSGFADAD